MSRFEEYLEMAFKRSDFRHLCLNSLNTLLKHFVKCILFPNDTSRKKWISEILNYLNEVKVKVYPSKKHPTFEEYFEILYRSWSDNETKLTNIQSIIIDEYKSLTKNESFKKFSYEELQEVSKKFFIFICKELGSEKALNIEELKEKIVNYL